MRWRKQWRKRMDRRHKDFIRHLAHLTLSGSEQDAKESVCYVMQFLAQRYPRHAKEALAYYWLCLRSAYRDRYAVVEYVGQCKALWLEMFKKGCDKNARRRWVAEEHPELLGGFKVHIGDTVWDVSLKGQLETFVKHR